MTRKKDKIKRVLKAIQNKADIDNIFLMSSSVAFHSFLSFIPIISVLVGIYLILNFNLDWGHFSLVKEFVPPEVYNMVERQAERINTNLDTINIATAFSFLISLWLANNVTRTLAQSLNIVFDKKNEKHFLFSLGESILYTLLLISSFLFLGLMLTVLPILFSLVEFAQKWEFLFLAVQWVVIAFYMVFGLCFVYKYLPAHGTKINWKQFLPGAFVATGFGSAFALMFSFYVSNFGSYSKVYGALGVIIITMLWLRLTFASILFGGEVNYFLLKDPSLREYFSLKAAFHDKLEDQTIKINWVRSVSVVFVIVLVGFRLYLPSKISKDIKDRFNKDGLDFIFTDVDIQTFFGDYHLEDVVFKLEYGLFKAQIAYNDIGWKTLGAKGGNTGLIYSDWKASIHSDSLDVFFEKFLYASDIIAFKSVKYVELKSGNVLLKEDQQGRVVRLKIDTLLLDTTKNRVSAHLEIENEDVFFLKGDFGEGRFKGELFKNGSNVKAVPLDITCDFKECPSIFMERLLSLMRETGFTSD